MSSSISGPESRNSFPSESDDPDVAYTRPYTRLLAYDLRLRTQRHTKRTSSRLSCANASMRWVNARFLPYSKKASSLTLASKSLRSRTTYEPRAPARRSPRKMSLSRMRRTTTRTEPDASAAGVARRGRAVRVVRSRNDEMTADVVTWRVLLNPS